MRVGALNVGWIWSCQAGGREKDDRIVNFQFIFIFSTTTNCNNTLLMAHEKRVGVMEGETYG